MFLLTIRGLGRAQKGAGTLLGKAAVGCAREVAMCLSSPVLDGIVSSLSLWAGAAMRWHIQTPPSQALIHELAIRSLHTRSSKYERYLRFTMFSTSVPSSEFWSCSRP